LVIIIPKRAGLPEAQKLWQDDDALVVPAKAMVRLAGKALSTAVAATCGFSMSVQGSGSGTTVTSS